MNNKGFSLVELMVVIVIFGITAFLGIFGINSAKRYAIATSREQMIQALRSARAEAVSRNTNVGVELLNAANGTLAIRTYNAAFTAQTTLRTLNVDSTQVRFVYAFLNTSTINGGSSGVVFNSQGSVANSIANPVQVTLRHGPLFNAVSINNGTGYIR